MTNDTCAMGARNKQKVDDVEKWCARMEPRITDVEKAVGKIPWLILQGGLTFLAVVITLITVILKVQ